MESSGLDQALPADLTQRSELGEAPRVLTEEARTPRCAAVSVPRGPGVPGTVSLFLEVSGPQEEHKAKSEPAKLAC